MSTFLLVDNIAHVTAASFARGTLGSTSLRPPNRLSQCLGRFHIGFQAKTSKARRGQFNLHVCARTGCSSRSSFPLWFDWRNSWLLSSEFGKGSPSGTVCFNLADLQSLEFGLSHNPRTIDEPPPSVEQVGGGHAAPELERLANPRSQRAMFVNGKKWKEEKQVCMLKHIASVAASFCGTIAVRC